MRLSLLKFVGESMMTKARETFSCVFFSPSLKPKQTLTFDFALLASVNGFDVFLLVSLGLPRSEKTKEKRVLGTCVLLLLPVASYFLSRMDMKTQVRKATLVCNFRFSNEPPLHHRPTIPRAIFLLISNSHLFF